MNMSPGVPGLGGGPAQSRRGKDEESCGSCGFGHRIPVRPEHRLEQPLLRHPDRCREEGLPRERRRLDALPSDLHGLTKRPYLAPAPAGVSLSRSSARAAERRRRGGACGERWPLSKAAGRVSSTVGRGQSQARRASAPSCSPSPSAMRGRALWHKPSQSRRPGRRAPNLRGAAKRVQAHKRR
jgi:hypothetical protein